MDNLIENEANIYIENLGKKAKSASVFLAQTSLAQRNEALQSFQKVLRASVKTLLEANAKDIEQAKANGIKASLIDRLLLTEERIESMALAIDTLLELPDPLGHVLRDYKHPKGFSIIQKTVPLGVLGVIFEARPNVSFDAASLAIKSGNAVILRGGKEALESNLCLTQIMQKALEAVGFPKDAVSLVTFTDRRYAVAMMRAKGSIDVLIPRGSANLIQAVLEQSTVPVLETGAGVCHLYFAESANLESALPVILNAKCQRPSVCNACECLLIHEARTKDSLVPIVKALLEQKVLLKLDSKAWSVLSNQMADFSEKYRDVIQPLSSEDIGMEYNALILNIQTVSSVQEAMAHIARYGTGHSECILTEDFDEAKLFMETVDAAAVYHNISTRFTDGGEFGLGAEIGISTQKLHARGPLGIEELCTSKYFVQGSTAIR